MALSPKFKRGDNVRILSSGKIGTVNEVFLRPDNVGYRVTVHGRTATYQEKYLEPFIDEEQRIMDGLSMHGFSGTDSFRLFQTWFRLKRPVEGNFYSFLGSRTIFNPYQFKPLSKFLSPGSEERLYIADEVGVGKTIETGIILTELVARGQLDRRSPILVVCPNTLGPKWVKELRQRFNLRFHLHDGKSLRTTLSCALGGYIPDAYMWSVASLQLMRTKNCLDPLLELSATREAPVWFMVIVDEAHHMRNRQTESNLLGNTLSALTEAMLMLSATPLNLKDEDLFNQMHILNPAMFPDFQTFNALLSPVKSINRCRRLLAQNSPTVYGEILMELKELEAGPLGRAISDHPGLVSLSNRMKGGEKLTNAEIARNDRLLISLSPLDNSFTRTLKREALKHRVVREPIKVPVQLSHEERKFYDDVIRLSQEAYLAKGGSAVELGFVTNMPMRMVSSCIPAMRDYLNWCLESSSMLSAKSNATEEADDDSELATVPLPPELRLEYERLRDQAERLSHIDTKYQQLSGLIHQLMSNLENPQVIVFSFFVRTLKYLEKRLTNEGYRVGLICGEVPVVSDGTQPGRYDIIEAFERRELDILLSSEVGGEGLDFQFCQAIVNYDLPYNPMRVEQRIGRVDRFGQSADKVVVASMYIGGTIDENIYLALYERIRLIEDSVGALEPIVGTKLTDLQRDIIIGHLSEEQLEIRMKEVELAVEQAKVEMEEFESNRQELMGDDYFTGPLHNLAQGTNLVHPSDAATLTSICLSFWEGCKYERVDENRGLLTISKDLVARLEQYTRRPGSEESIDELRPLLNSKGSTPVIFNGSLADRYPDHHFIPPCGFWTRFLLSELESAGNIARVFSFSSTNKELLRVLEPGFHVVPMFEIRLEGFRVELDVAAVPVSLLDKRIPDCDFRKLSRLIACDISDVEPTAEFPDLAEPEVFIDLARQTLEAQMEEKIQLLRAENRYRIEARVNSLERGSQVRIERLQDRISEHRERTLLEGMAPNADFIRLIQGQMDFDRRRTSHKIENLRSKSELSLALSLIGVVLLDVQN